jgi:hypothetical protein
MFARRRPDTVIRTIPNAAGPTEGRPLEAAPRLSSAAPASSGPGLAAVIQADSS